MSYLGFFLFVSLASAGQHVRVCYYTNWSQYRDAPMNYFPEDIDPSLCTHIIYAFAQIGEGHILEATEWNDEDMFERFALIKQVEYLITLSKNCQREVYR